KEMPLKPVISTPTSAEQNPERMYTLTKMISTLVPERRATRTLLPTAKTLRPKVVQCNSAVATTAKASRNHTAGAKPKPWPLKNQGRRGGAEPVGMPPV